MAVEWREVMGRGGGKGEGGREGRRESARHERAHTHAGTYHPTLVRALSGVNVSAGSVWMGRHCM